MENSGSSKKSIIIYILIIVIVIPLLFLAFAKFSNNPSFKIPDNPITKKIVPSKFESEYLTLKIPKDLTQVKNEPEIGAIELKTEDGKAVFILNSSQTSQDAVKGDKTPVENAMDYAIERERPYYAEFIKKTKVGDYDALLFATDTPKDPATQENLPPLKAYYVYIPTQIDGKDVIKEVKILYWGDSTRAETFEKLISDIQFKN